MSTQDPRSATGRDLKIGPGTRDASARPNPPITLPFNPDDDRFAVPDSVKRPGWRLEWKRYLNAGMPDQRNVSALNREEWKIVPADRWPGFQTDGMGELMPKVGYIQLEDLVLMERKEATCQAVETYFHDKTANQTAARDAALGESSDPKNFPRTQPRTSESVEGPVSGPPDRSRAADGGEDYE